MDRSFGRHKLSSTYPSDSQKLRRKCYETKSLLDQEQRDCLAPWTLSQTDFHPYCCAVVASVDDTVSSLALLPRRQSRRVRTEDNIYRAGRSQNRSETLPSGMKSITTLVPILAFSAISHPPARRVDVTANWGGGVRSFYGRLAPSREICSLSPPFEAACHSKARSFVLRARDRRGCASKLLASPLFTFSAFNQGRLTLLVVHSRVGVGQTTAWFCGLFVPTSSEKKKKTSPTPPISFSIGLPNSNSLE